MTVAVTRDTPCKGTSVVVVITREAHLAELTLISGRTFTPKTQNRTFTHLLYKKCHCVDLIKRKKQHVFMLLKIKLSTRMGFEPTRAEHNGLAVHRLNHSATSSHINKMLHLHFSLAVAKRTLSVPEIMCITDSVHSVYRNFFLSKKFSPFDPCCWTSRPSPFCSSKVNLIQESCSEWNVGTSNLDGCDVGLWTFKQFLFKQFSIQELIRDMGVRRLFSRGGQKFSRGGNNLLFA